MAIRIQQGRLKGKSIPSPKDNTIRPTSSMVRESLFQILQNKIPDAHFLDLFTGTGMMGFMAWSMGAGFVMSIDHDKGTVKRNRKEQANLNIPREAMTIIHTDSFALTKQAFNTDKLPKPFDVVFIDPPYAERRYSELVGQLVQGGWVCKDGLLVLEHDKHQNKTLLPELLEVETTCAELMSMTITQRQFGNTFLTFIQLEPA